MKVFSTIFALTAAAGLLSSCGGSSSGGAKGTPDATSRQNAFNASVNGGANAKATPETSQSAGLPYFLSLAADNSSSADSTSGVMSGEFSEKCDKAGTVSGTWSFDPNSTSGFLEVEAVMNFEGCKDDDSGVVNGGPLTALISAQSFEADSFSMLLNGTVNAEGKNAKGEMAPHKLSFKDTGIGFFESSETSGGEAFSSMSCSGTIIVDGKESSCEALMTEETESNSPGTRARFEDGTDSDSSSSSSSTVSATNTQIFTSVVNGEGKGVLIFERSGKKVGGISSVVFVERFEGNEVEADSQYLSSLDESARSDVLAYLDDMTGLAQTLSSFSKNAAAIGFEDPYGFEDFSAVRVYVIYTDETEEMIERAL